MTKTEAIEAEQEPPENVTGGSVRVATEADMPRILRYGSNFHAQSGQPFPFNDDSAHRFAQLLINSNDAEIFIHDSGMIGGALVPAYCTPNWVMAVELFWWAERGGIRLLNAFENWATAKRADEVRMTSLATLERADRLLRKQSYAPAEISYRKVL